MSELTREKVEAWRSLGAAYVEHMPDGDAVFTALCDMALESITLKLEPGACSAVAELADLKQRILPQFAGRTERAERARDGVLKAVEDAFLQHHAATQEQADFANAILRTIRKGSD